MPQGFICEGIVTPRWSLIFFNHSRGGSSSAPGTRLKRRTQTRRESRSVEAGAGDRRAPEPGLEGFPATCSWGWLPTARLEVHPYRQDACQALDRRPGLRGRPRGCSESAFLFSLVRPEGWASSRSSIAAFCSASAARRLDRVALMGDRRRESSRRLAVIRGRRPGLGPSCPRIRGEPILQCDEPAKVA